MEFLKFEINPSVTPTPHDKEAEVDVTNRLIDLCESPELHPPTSSLAAFGQITPWVAWQLGCFAEYIAEQRDYEKAFRIAAISVQAAIEAKDSDRLYANLLTLSGILLRDGNLEEAKSQFFNILELPFPGGENERASAHMSLGSIFEQGSTVDEALYHYEIGLGYLRKTMSEQAHRKMLEHLSHLYADAEDAAGLAHCCMQLGLGDAEEILRQNVSQEMHVEEVLYWTTRLHSLEEHKLADTVFELWREGFPRTGRPDMPFRCF